MKFPLILALALGICAAYATDITGEWNGMLDVQVMQLRIVFHISETEHGLSATMDSPDQNAFDIPVSSTTFENSILTLTLNEAGIKYTGELKDSEIQGTFQQAGQQFPLTLIRDQIEKHVYFRPQEPSEPYPYYTEEITFKNEEAGIKLAGTLIMPDTLGIYPTVVMITGSGPQDRDEKVFEHRPFWIIADYLARNGIASLRFDDRGTANSEGKFSEATTMDFASDVSSAVAYLKTRKGISEIGLIGHSEGGIIAPIVASRSKDIKFIVLLAGTGVRGDSLLLLQQEAIARASGTSEEEIEESSSINKIAFKMAINAADLPSFRTELQKYLEKIIDDGTLDIPEGSTKQEFIAMQLDGVCNPWMFSFIRLDPAPYLEKVKCPVLALNGSKDLQVPSMVNLPAIKDALIRGGNKNVTTIELQGLNHLFQAAKTGLIEEYISIEQTISPVVLETISDWINKTGIK